jgi:hypothetical protein
MLIVEVYFVLNLLNSWYKCKIYVCYIRLCLVKELLRSHNHLIMTAQKLFDWAESNIANINFAFVSAVEWIYKGRNVLFDSFSKVNLITGTWKIDTFLPVKRGVLCTKSYSFSSEFVQHCVSSCKEIWCSLCIFTQGNMMLNLENIRGFVKCFYDDFQCLDCVLSTNETIEEVKTSFLHPYCPSPSYIFPFYPDFVCSLISILN